jgi:quinol monooxygenase YgiN
VDHADELFLVEKYRDAGAVAEHVRQTHTAKLVELKERYVSDMVLEQYEASGSAL